MLLPRIRSFAPLAALLLACDATPTPRAVAHSSSADAETPALTEMAAKPDAKAASEEGAVLKSAGDGRPKSLAKADAATLQETRAQLLAALNEGRAHVKAGRHDEGIEKFEALLKIDPHHRAALSELGWAEFKAGRHDVARAHTLRALSLAEEPGQRGMLQYNLGRVAEARSQPSVALAHYE
ncbi:MAG: tetratricopeptide repeat protein, partial [Myxococcales bacterium]|nr:tetratricopeptide repeat protein [Myxococcales bacterium]